jgi:hypothetical protein
MSTSWAGSGIRKYIRLLAIALASSVAIDGAAVGAPPLGGAERGSRTGAQVGCGPSGVALQVLGSGGPELQDKRASTSYLVWRNGVPRVLVDSGGGSALRFGESGATMSDLDVILLTHLHVDHSPRSSNPHSSRNATGHFPSTARMETRSFRRPHAS